MLEIATASALIAFVYAVVLTAPEEILFRWGRWLYNVTWNDSTSRNHWIYKLLIGCEKCIAGQMCLWWYLIRNFKHYTPDLVIWHIFTICLGIFFAIIIKKIYNTCQG